MAPLILVGVAVLLVVAAAILWVARLFRRKRRRDRDGWFDIGWPTGGFGGGDSGGFGGFGGGESGGAGAGGDWDFSGFDIDVG